jgi:cytochrome P450
MMPTPTARTDWLSLAEEPADHHARLLDAIRRGGLGMTTLGDTSLLTAYSRRDAVGVLTDEARFSADVVALKYFPVFGRQPLMSDDRHWRRTVRAELARHIRAAHLDRPRVREIVIGVLDELSPGQEHDLFTAIAGQISARVFARLLGVPNDIGAAIATHAADVARFGLSPLAGLRAAGRLRASLVSAMGDGAGQATSGLLGSLTRCAAGQSISQNRLLDSLLMLTLAGTETTTAAISTMLYALLGLCPDKTALHEAQPAPAAAAAAETLRWEPPVQMTCRRVTTDCVINNTQLRRDSLVLIHLGAASLDGDDAGPDPATFSLARPGRPATLAFGSGPHRCPGARLAWSELEITAGEVLRRFPRAALTEPGAVRVSGSMLRIAAPLRARLT